MRPRGAAEERSVYLVPRRQLPKPARPAPTMARRGIESFVVPLTTHPFTALLIFRLLLRSVSPAPSSMQAPGYWISQGMAAYVRGACVRVSEGVPAAAAAGGRTRTRGAYSYLHGGYACVVVVGRSMR